MLEGELGAREDQLLRPRSGEGPLVPRHPVEDVEHRRREGVAWLEDADRGLAATLPRAPDTPPESHQQNISKKSGNRREVCPIEPLNTRRVERKTPMVCEAPVNTEQP